MVASHILVVEDDTKLAQFLESELNQDGYRVTVAHDGYSGLVSARDVQPDLLILDWMLPGISGLEVCKRLRSTGNKTPVIMLTAKDEVPDRVTGLDAGADDYVVKPFNTMELLARVRAHLRWTHPNTSDTLQFEDLVVHPQAREVYRGMRYINLTAKEFDLLEWFMRHPKQVLTRSQLLDRIWGEDFTGDSNIIDVFIRQLRLKLEANGEKRVLHTVRSIGYVLRDSL